MANGDDQIDLNDEIRKRFLLQNMGRQQPVSPQDSPVQTQQLMSPPQDMPPQPQAPVAPSLPPSFYGAPVTPPPQAPVGAPPPNPFQAQIDEINQNVKAMGQAGQQVATLKGQQPNLNQYPVSKLRAALMMPLQILAGAGGRDTSAQYAASIRPGYTGAVTDYQAKLNAAQGKLDALRETTKTQLEALKDEGTISKDQADILGKQADVELKKQELGLRAQQAKIDEENIAPFNQYLQKAKDEAAAKGIPYTTEMMRKDVDDYQTSYDRARYASEKAKWEAERADKEKDAKLNRQRITIGQQIEMDQRNLEKGIEPIVRAKQNITNLINAIDQKDAGGVENLLNVIRGDMTLTPGIGRGSVRQNMGMIQGLIKAPGFWDTVAGYWKGLTQPGKGTIPDETIQQMRKYAVQMLNGVNDEGTYYQDHIDKLRDIDPVTDPEAARQTWSGVMKGFYDGAAGPPPKGIEPSPDKPKVPVTDEQIKEIEQQFQAVSDAINKKTKKK